MSTKMTHWSMVFGDAARLDVFTVLQLDAHVAILGFGTWTLGQSLQTEPTLRKTFPFLSSRITRLHTPSSQVLTHWFRSTQLLRFRSGQTAEIGLGSMEKVVGLKSFCDLNSSSQPRGPPQLGATQSGQHGHRSWISPASTACEHEVSSPKCGETPGALAGLLHASGATDAGGPTCCRVWCGLSETCLCVLCFFHPCEITH